MCDTELSYIVNYRLQRIIACLYYSENSLKNLSSSDSFKYFPVTPKDFYFDVSVKKKTRPPISVPVRQ